MEETAVLVEPHAPNMEPNLRRLRMYLAVFDAGNFHRAAETLHLTQSTLTKAVQKLEQGACVRLFERTHRGMVPTEFGRILARRARRALDYLGAAEDEAFGIDDTPPPRSARGFSAKLTHRQLMALIGIYDNQTETAAAAKLSVSQPAITLALRDVEQLVGRPLFLRTPRGMVATVHGEIAVRYAKLALREVEEAASDIASHQGQMIGRVVVGLLPTAGTLLPSRAISSLLLEYPDLQVSVVDGTFRSLMQSLRCGDVDVILGTLSHPTPAHDIVKTDLVHDAISIVVRAGHPLAAKTLVAVADLVGADWVVPRSNTPVRVALDLLLEAAGLEVGPRAIECNSLPTVRALLVESDRLSVISGLQLGAEPAATELVALPIDLSGPPMCVGAGIRIDAAPSEGVSAFMRHLHQVAGTLDLECAHGAADGGSLQTPARKLASRVREVHAQSPS